MKLKYICGLTLFYAEWVELEIVGLLIMDYLNNELSLITSAHVV